MTILELLAQEGPRERRNYYMWKNTADPDMLPEYDFSHGMRGKYAKRYAEGTNVVMIEPDVFEFFPDQESVNEALRGLVTIIKRGKSRQKISRTNSSER
jgi:hypothetical protein